MTGVDWDEAECQERRRDLLLGPGTVAFLAGIVLLTGGLGPVTGVAAWALIGAFAVVGLLAMAVPEPTLRRRGGSRRPYRVQAALHCHADPGPELRVRTDTQARYTARTSWVVWAFPLGPLSLLLDGQWDRRPVAATVGAVLVVGAAVAYVSWWRVRVADARRWLAGPPGPPREPAPPTRAERWLTGRRVAFVAGSAFVLALAATVSTCRVNAAASSSVSEAKW